MSFTSPAGYYSFVMGPRNCGEAAVKAVARALPKALGCVLSIIKQAGKRALRISGVVEGASIGAATLLCKTEASRSGLAGMGLGLSLAALGNPSHSLKDNTFATALVLLTGSGMLSIDHNYFKSAGISGASGLALMGSTALITTLAAHRPTPSRENIMAVLSKSVAGIAIGFFYHGHAGTRENCITYTILYRFCVHALPRAEFLKASAIAIAALAGFSSGGVLGGVAAASGLGSFFGNSRALYAFSKKQFIAYMRIMPSSMLHGMILK